MKIELVCLGEKQNCIGGCRLADNRKLRYLDALPSITSRALGGRRVVVVA